MTWYETLYWWSFLVVPIFILIVTLIVEVEDILGLIPIYWILALISGALTAVFVQIGDTEFVETAIVEKVTLSETITDFGLDLVTDEGQHIRFTDYKDIKNWEDGAKLYKIYLYNKINFGPDSSYEKLVLRKIEQ